MSQIPSTPRKLDIRSARESDLPRLEALPFSAGLPSKHRDRLSRQAAGRVGYLLAVDDGRIIGHLLLKWDCPAHPDVRRLIPSCAEIEDFVVEPAARGQGVGSALLDDAAQRCRARGETRLGLAVGHENPSARSIYEHRGFVVVPGSAHRVSWLARDKEGREIEDHEDCVYLVRELG